MNRAAWWKDCTLVLALGLAACNGSREQAHATQRPGAAADPHADHDGAGAAPPPAGFAPIMVSPAQARALNLTTALVEERDFTKVIRSVGVVTPDETRTSHVHAKVRGFIEDIAVSYVGQEVRKGQPLCGIYSQEVLATKLELLTLLELSNGRSPAAPAAGPFAEADRRAQERLIDAARRRLALFDVPRAEIAELERTREARRTFTLRAPRSGVVLAKQALLGALVDPSVELYLISDLSRVWVLVDVYEADLPFVRLGQKARIAVAGQDAPIEATATFLAPTLDEATRTMKVRFELDNPGGRLRPGSFATAELEVDMGRGLAVSESAVIRTGARAIVFVVHGEHIEPREVTLGPSVGGALRVEAGLSAGDEVATGAQFLLDSESRLRATDRPGSGHAH